MADKLPTLEDPEMAYFHRFWNVFEKYHARNGTFAFYTDQHKKWALKTVKEYKKGGSTSGSSRLSWKFRGSSSRTSGTYGIREIMVQDLVTDPIAPGTVTQWDQTWGTVGERNWLGGTSPFDAGSFDDGQEARTRDTSQREWFVDIWGIMDLDDAPGKIGRIVYKLTDDPHASHMVEQKLRFSELAVYFFPERIAIRTQPFKIGVDVYVSGDAVMVPLGITITDFERMKNQDRGALSRPLPV